MGLYLLLLLTRGDYAGFHCVLEGLEMEAGIVGNDDDDDGVDGATGGLEEDRFIGYPVRLERWLMEGSYDRVWKATKGGVGVPGEEEGVFSEVCWGYFSFGDLGLRLRWHFTFGAAGISHFVTCPRRGAREERVRRFSAWTLLASFGLCSVLVLLVREQ